MAGTSVGARSPAPGLVRLATAVVVAGVAVSLALGWAHGPASRSSLTASFVDSGRPVNVLAPPRTTTPVLLTAARARGLTSMPWRLTGLDPAAASVTIDHVTGDGDCTTPVGLRIQESATTVVITALSRTDPRREVCAAKSAAARSVVPLHAPLGDRRLVHPATDASWTLPPGS